MLARRIVSMWGRTPSAFPARRLSSVGTGRRPVLPDDGLDLKHFVKQSGPQDVSSSQATFDPLPSPFLSPLASSADGRKFFVETYGCQMNFSDSEIINSVLTGAGYEMAEGAENADVILLNTCAIRDNAEQKVWGRLRELKAHIKKSKTKQTVGVLGCMAERLKEKLLESEGLCHLVVGPDAYRDLPRLLSRVEDGHSAINVLLSLDETYADVAPVRTADNTVSAYVSIMRGCNNMCSYCIVPFTRGRERSREVASIVREVKDLSERGYKEVILLGQNVNSFNDVGTAPSGEWAEGGTGLAEGFRNISSIREEGVRFAELLHHVASVDPSVRVRFTSPHPKDFPDDVLHVVAHHDNICKSLHMPAQSGSSQVLERMRRGYSREAYMGLIERVREVVKGCAISSDFITGFCGETEEDHLQTLSLMRLVRFDMAYMFAYSMRERTHAHRTLTDDVPDDVKGRRLREMTELFYSDVKDKNRQEIGKRHVVLVEGNSRRSEEDFVGRTDSNKKVVFPKRKVAAENATGAGSGPVDFGVGDYVEVEITESGVTLKGIPLRRSSSPSLSS